MPNFVKIGESDAKILIFFSIFKTKVAVILDFRIRENLLADGVWMVQLHHCAKVYHNRSFHCGYIEICRIFKVAAVCHLGSLIGTNLDHLRRVLGVSVSVNNFVTIDVMILKIWKFQYLARMAGKPLFTLPKLGVSRYLTP